MDAPLNPALSVSCKFWRRQLSNVPLLPSEICTVLLNWEIHRRIGFFFFFFNKKDGSGFPSKNLPLVYNFLHLKCRHFITIIHRYFIFLNCYANDFFLLLRLPSGRCWKTQPWVTGRTTRPHLLKGILLFLTVISLFSWVFHIRSSYKQYWLSVCSCLMLILSPHVLWDDQHDRRQLCLLLDSRWHFKMRDIGIMSTWNVYRTTEFRNRKKVGRLSGSVN